MKLTTEHPVYLNPNDSELIELAESRWDTLRVLESESILCIASGYGNTHQTLVWRYCEYHGMNPRYTEYPKRFRYNGRLPDWNPLIFFHDNSGIMLCNLGDVSGPIRQEDIVRFSKT